MWNIFFIFQGKKEGGKILFSAGSKKPELSHIFFPRNSDHKSTYIVYVYTDKPAERRERESLDQWRIKGREIESYQECELLFFDWTNMDKSATKEKVQN